MEKVPLYVKHMEFDFCLTPGGGGGGGVLPILAYTGRLRPKGGTFFRLQVYKRVGISQVEVYKSTEIGRFTA